MTTTIIILAVYIVGCVLAYGKDMAISYELDEEFITNLPPETTKTEFILLIASTFSSYMGFIAALYSSKELGCTKYWFKWSKKDLWKQYYENQK